MTWSPFGNALAPDPERAYLRPFQTDDEHLWRLNLVDPVHVPVLTWMWWQGGRWHAIPGPKDVGNQLVRAAGGRYHRARTVRRIPRVGVQDEIVCLATTEKVYQR